jgi:hypothetical protein
LGQSARLGTWLIARPRSHMGLSPEIHAPEEYSENYVAPGNGMRVMASAAGSQDMITESDAFSGSNHDGFLQDTFT